MRPDRITALLVEDDAADAALLRRTVAATEGAHLALSHVERLADGLARVQLEPFHAVLLDLTLPDARGLEGLDAFTAMAPHVPVVVLTGLEDEALAVEAVRHGAQDYLTKGRIDGRLVVRALRYAIERHRTEQALRASEARLQEVVDHLPDGVVLLDGRLAVALANPPASDWLPLLTGRPANAPVVAVGGVPLTEILAKSRGLEPVEVVLEGPPARAFEVRARQLGGAGERTLLALRDVTSERHLRRTAETQGRLAAVGQLAAGVAHDFNNLLQVVIGQAGLCADDPDVPHRVAQQASTIRQRCLEAATTVQKILAFSRHSLLDRRELDLSDFVAGSVEVLRRAIPETIRVRHERGDERLRVRADEGRLQHLLMNLALNAQDAMPDGGELVVALDRLDVRPDDTIPVAGLVPGSWAALSVRDTGTGIPEDIRSRVFEPFFTTHELGGGAGLGLAQAYGLVAQHDGVVDLTTEVGRGTTVTVYLPLWETDAAAAAPDQESPADEGEVDGATVLVVEDDDDVRVMLGDLLGSEGYEVCSACNGREALEVLDRPDHGVDLVMTDQMMPEMGGLELARTLHERAGPGVVMLTGYPMAAQAAALPEGSVLAWLQKPIGLEELSGAVQRALARAARAA